MCLLVSCVISVVVGLVLWLKVIMKVLLCLNGICVLLNDSVVVFGGIWFLS